MSRLSFNHWARQAFDDAVGIATIRREWSQQVAPQLVKELLQAVQGNELAELESAWSFVNDPTIDRLFSKLIEIPADAGPRLQKHVKALIAGCLSRLLVAASAIHRDEWVAQSIAAWTAVYGNSDQAQASMKVWDAVLLKANGLGLEALGVSDKDLLPANRQSVKSVGYQGREGGLVVSLFATPLPDCVGGPVVHPALGALTTASPEIEEIAMRAWNAAVEAGGEAKFKSLAWWIDTDAKGFAMEGDSISGIMAALFAAVRSGRQIDPSFAASVAIHIDDPKRLVPVGAVFPKAKAALGAKAGANEHLVSRMFTHIEDAADARLGATSANRDPYRCVVFGDTVADLIAASQWSGDTVFTLARNELSRRIRNVGDLASQIVETCDKTLEEWVPQRAHYSLQGSWSQVAEPWDDIRSRHPDSTYWLVDGAPGSGKSDLLRREMMLKNQNFIRSLERGSPRQEEPIAVLFRAIDIAPTSEIVQDPMSYLAFKIGQLYQIDALDAIKEMVATGMCEIYIDAIEDLPRVQSVTLSNILHEIRTQRKDAPMKVVVTVREGTEAHLEWSRLGFARASLVPFNLAQVRDCLKRMAGKDAESKDWFAGLLKVGELMSTPLMLRLAVDVLRSKPMSLTSRTALYEAYVNVAIEKWSRKPPIPPSHTVVSFRDSVEVFALDLLNHSYSPNAPKELVKKLCEKRAHEHPGMQGRSLERDLEESGFLIGDQDSDTYHFFHLTIAEYLAARQIARQIDRAEPASRKRLIEQFCSNRQWTEPMVFAVAHVRDPASYMSSLVERAEKTDDDAVLVIASRALIDLRELAQSTR